MRITIKNLTRVSIMGLVVALSGIAGCKSSTSDRTSHQVSSDRATAKDVKKALEDAPIFKYPDVDATVYDGNVQLTGFVDTTEQRLQAAQIASGVKGVNQVINNIMIKSTPTGRATVRDPLGHDTGRVMVDTNAPPPNPLHMGPNDEPPKSGTQQTPQGTTPESTPNRTTP